MSLIGKEMKTAQLVLVVGLGQIVRQQLPSGRLEVYWLELAQCHLADSLHHSVELATTFTSLGSII